MDAWLDTIIGNLTGLMTQNMWFAPLLSLVAGVVTSFTPCSLSAVPMALAYMEGTSEKEPKKALRLSLFMALGMAVTFGVFGSLASVIGHVMHDVGHWWSILMGVLMILMALQMWDVIRIFPGHEHNHDHDGCDAHSHKSLHNHSHAHGENHSHDHKKNHGHLHQPEEDCNCRVCSHTRPKGKGYAGAFFTGALGGVFASHCAAPVMVALLAMVAQSEKGPFWGIFLMVLYAFGHSILMVLAGTSYSVVDGWIKNPKYERISKRLRGMVGTVILLIGIVMLFL